VWFIPVIGLNLWLKYNTSWPLTFIFLPAIDFYSAPHKWHWRKGITIWYLQVLVQPYYHHKNLKFLCCWAY
jgi:hypothetical protein